MEQQLTPQQAKRLRRQLTQLAASLRPFPAFWGMTSIQAVELDPLGPGWADRGCVVVTPQGEICQLNITGIPGAPGLADQDHVEEFQELDLPLEEYAAYARAAIAVLTAELDRRG